MMLIRKEPRTRHQYKSTLIVDVHPVCTGIMPSSHGRVAVGRETKLRNGGHVGVGVGVGVRRIG